jgi:hypothetical protein
VNVGEFFNAFRFVLLIGGKNQMHNVTSLYQIARSKLLNFIHQQASVQTVRVYESNTIYENIMHKFVNPIEINVLCI